MTPLAEPLEAAASLLQTAETTADGGKTVKHPETGAWVHSRRAALREAERLAATADPKPMQPVILLGSGLGDTILELIRRLPDCKICVFESNLSMLRTALERHDFSVQIRRGLLSFACEVPGMTPSLVFETFVDEASLYGHSLVQHLYASNVPGCVQLFSAFGNWLRQRAIGMRSETVGGRFALSNLLGNLPHWLTTAGPHAMAGSLKGVPAVVVAAGPSLQRNIDALREHSGKVFVLAVSSALKRVMSAGIEVHATNVVDYSHLSQRYFRDLPGDAPPLWAHPRCSDTVLDGYQGQVVTCDDALYQDLRIPGVPLHGDFPHIGNNVSHYGYQVCRLLGCNPIILCGMDFSYSFHITHVPGSQIHEEWSASAGRFATLEQREIQFLTAMQVPGDKAKQDQYGNPLYSDELMESAARHLENMTSLDQSSDKSLTVFNCTEGGRPLKGVPDRPLREVLQEVTRDAPDFAEYYSRLSKAAATSASSLKAGLTAIRAIRKALEGVPAKSQPVLRLLKQARERLEAGRGGSFHAREFDWLNDHLESVRGIWPMLAMLQGQVRIRRKMLEARLSDEKLGETERLRLLAQRETEWVEAIEKSAADLAEMLDHHITRISQWQTTPVASPAGATK